MIEIPKHPDFVKIHRQFLKRYGDRGEEVYHRWLNERNLDDTKPMPKKIKRASIDGDVIDFNSESVGLKGAKWTNFEIVMKPSKPEVKIVATKDGKKKAIISGTLMNTKFNDNDWRYAPEDGERHASDIKGLPLKVVHGDDYTICGKGLEGQHDSNTGDVLYTTQVTGEKEVKKFESGEWDADTMGVSPSLILHKRVECSICGEDIHKCEHEWRQEYDGKVCRVTIHGSRLSEHSLTSEAAYKAMGAGNIDNVLIAAIQGGKMEEKEKKEFEAKLKEKGDLVAEKDKVIAEKEGEIKDLNDKVNKMAKKAEGEGEGEDKDKDNPPEKPPEGGEEGGEKPPEKGEGEEKPEEKVKAELKEREKELESSKKELEETKSKLDTYVRAERQVKLEKVFDKEKHKGLISSILDRKLPDKVFEAKIMELEAVKTFSASNEGSGSLPADGNREISRRPKRS